MSFVDALVIAACVRRPIRFVMDHRIFRIPLLSFIFRAMRAIPIAPAREDPALKERAFAEVAAALARRRARRHLPRRRAHARPASSIAFRPGIQQILATTPVPVVPMALRGLWGSLFSRSHGRARMRRLRGCSRGSRSSRAAPCVPDEATPESLFAHVRALRGDAR